MPRKVIPPSSEFPYHIVARCINRDWFDIEIDKVWTIMEDYLFFLHHAFGVEILAFTLMSNHFHLLARFPHGNMSESLRYFMRETSRQITKKGKRINQTYGQRFFRSLIDNPHYYNHAYKYLYRNPVEAQLCNTVLDYPFSTLPGLLGLMPLKIPVSLDSTLFSDVEGTLKWLNTPPKNEYIEVISKAIKRSKFELALERVSRKKHPLENVAY